MPRKPGQKFGRASSHNPDGFDLCSIAREVLLLGGAELKWSVECVSISTLLVIGEVYITDKDGDLLLYSASAYCTTTSESLTSIMMQVAHRIYHQVDRDLAKILP
jgi:hypothetical protein